MRTERFINDVGQEFLFIGLKHDEVSIHARPDGISVTIGPISVHDWGRLRDVATPVESPTYLGAAFGVAEDDE